MDLLNRFWNMGFEINWFKSINCITDQGVNIVKALEPFKKFNCSAHMLNAVLRNISLLSKTVKHNIDTRWNSKYFMLWIKQWRDGVYISYWCWTRRWCNNWRRLCTPNTELVGIRGSNSRIGPWEKNRFDMS